MRKTRTRQCRSERKRVEGKAMEWKLNKEKCSSRCSFISISRLELTWASQTWCFVFFSFFFLFLYLTWKFSRVLPLFFMLNCYYCFLPGESNDRNLGYRWSSTTAACCYDNGINRQKFFFFSDLFYYQEFELLFINTLKPHAHLTWLSYPIILDFVLFWYSWKNTDCIPATGRPRSLTNW